MENRKLPIWHLAIERLTSIDAPVVAAVRGGAGGGGLGLLYAADVVVAADDARFALGYGALGRTADRGNTWFLPRMVGMRQAQQESPDERGDFHRGLPQHSVHRLEAQRTEFGLHDLELLV